MFICSLFIPKSSSEFLRLRFYFVFFLLLLLLLGKIETILRSSGTCRQRQTSASTQFWYSEKHSSLISRVVCCKTRICFSSQMQSSTFTTSALYFVSFLQVYFNIFYSKMIKKFQSIKVSTPTKNLRDVFYMKTVGTTSCYKSIILTNKRSQ